MMSQKRRSQINSCFKIFMFAALCNLGFTICGSYIEQVWPPPLYIYIEGVGGKWEDCLKTELDEQLVRIFTETCFILSWSMSISGQMPMFWAIFSWRIRTEFENLLKKTLKRRSEHGRFNFIDANKLPAKALCCFPAQYKHKENKKSKQDFRCSFPVTMSSAIYTQPRRKDRKYVIKENLVGKRTSHYDVI